MLCRLGQWARRSTTMPSQHQAVAWRARQLWHTPAAAKLHNDPLPSVPASQSQAPFVAATASRPSGEGNRRYAKLSSLGTVAPPSALPVAFTSYAPPSGSLVAVVAPWRRSGASRSVLVSGLRPVILCVPRPPCGLAATRLWPCAGLPIRPQGAPSSQRQIRHAHLKKKMQQALRAWVA